MCEPFQHPDSGGMLFAKNHHDGVVYACSGTVQAVRCVHDRQSEGLDVRLWVGLSVSLISTSLTEMISTSVERRSI